MELNYVRFACIWGLLSGLLGFFFAEARADTFLDRLPLLPAAGCQHRVETPRLSEVPANERYSLTEIAWEIRRNPELLNELLARIPGRLVRLRRTLPGVPLHYDFFPAQNGSDEVEFKIGGIGDGVDKMRENTPYIAAHTRRKNVIYLSLTGQDLTLLLHHLEGRDHSAHYYAETLKAVVAEAMQTVLDDIEANQLAKTPLRRTYVLNALSWSGQLTMDFIADPRYNGPIEGVIFEDPGAQSLDRYFAPLSIHATHAMLEAQEQFLEELGVPAYFNVPRLYADIYRYFYRLGITTALWRNFPRYRSDPLLLRGTVNMVSGLYSVDGPKRLREAPARIWIKLLIAGKGDIVPPTLLERVGEAAMEREGGLGRRTTSVEILEGAPHELPRIADLTTQMQIAERTYDQFTPGWAIIAANQVVTRDEQQVRRRLHEMHWDWGLQNAWRKGRGR